MTNVNFLRILALLLYFGKTVIGERGIDIYNMVLENIELSKDPEVSTFFNDVSSSLAVPIINNESTSLSLEREFGSDFDLIVLQDKIGKCLTHERNEETRKYAEDYIFMQLFEDNDNKCSEIENNLWYKINPELENNITYLIENSLLNVELALAAEHDISIIRINDIFEIINEISFWLQSELYEFEGGIYLVNDISLHILRWLTNRKFANPVMFSCDEESLQNKLEQALELINECNSESFFNYVAEVQEVQGINSIGVYINDSFCKIFSIDLDIVLFGQLSVEISVKKPIEITSFFLAAGGAINVGIGGGLQLKGGVAQSTSWWSIDGGLVLGSGNYAGRITGGFAIAGNAGYLKNLNDLFRVRLRLTLQFMTKFNTIGAFMFVGKNGDSPFSTFGGGIIFGYGFNWLYSPLTIDLRFQAGRSTVIKNKVFDPVQKCKDWVAKFNNNNATLRPSVHPTFPPHNRTLPPVTPVPTIFPRSTRAPGHPTLFPHSNGVHNIMKSGTKCATVGTYGNSHYLVFIDTLIYNESYYCAKIYPIETDLDSVYQFEVTAPNGYSFGMINWNDMESNLVISTDVDGIHNLFELNDNKIITILTNSADCSFEKKKSIIIGDEICQFMLNSEFGQHQHQIINGLKAQIECGVGQQFELF